jgi:hypothetical protein
MPQSVLRLVGCFDGTWNIDRSNTNVSRLFRKGADASSGCPEQLRFYDEGVGTRFGERLRGGVLGTGLAATFATATHGSRRIPPRPPLLLAH